jgi:hypothetical protein
MDLIDAKGEFFVQTATDAAIYQINWAADLGLDTITGSPTWSAPAGLTGVPQSNTASTTDIKISGGTAGIEYAVTCTIGTAGGQTFKRTLWIRISPFPTLAANALIDLDYLKTAMRLYEANPDNSIDNVLLAQKIAEASDLIETLCNRTFKAGDYVERINWSRSVNLKQFPIQYVRSIHRTTRDGLVLKNTASGKDYATAWVSGNRKLYLNVAGGTSHGMQTIDLTLAANDTLGELISVINALSTGWVATLSGGRSGNERSEDLVELSAQIIDASSGLTLTLLDAPDSVGYQLNENAGIIEDLCSPYVVYDYRYNQYPAWVKYRAGYETIPDDLKGVAAMVAKHLVDESSRDSGLRSETIGDYSYTRETGQDLEGKRSSLPGNLLAAIAVFESPLVV